MITNKTVAAVAAGAVAGAVGISLAGGAFTASASPATASAASSTTVAATTTAAHKARPHRGGRLQGRAGFGGLAGGLLHGTGVVRTRTGFQTVAFDRGTVTAVSPTSVTITAADKDVETFTVVSTSRIRVAGKKATISDVKDGQTVGALAVVNGSAKDLKVLVVRPAKKVTA